MNLEQKILEVAPNINPEVVKLLSAQINANTVQMRWMFGICATGFFALAGWMWNLVRQMNATEKNVGVKIDADIKEVTKLLIDIRDALAGNLKEKGLITKHHELEERVNKLEGKP